MYFKYLYLERVFSYIDNVIIDFSNIKTLMNKKFYHLLWCIKRILIMFGGRGSGKSKFAAQKIVYRVVSEPGHKIGCFRKVAKTLKHSCWFETKLVIEEWGLTPFFVFNKTEMTATYFENGKASGLIVMLGMDDKEKIKSFAGMTAGWIEEATEFTMQDIIDIDLILRGSTKYYKQLILTFNPIDIFHWLKGHYFDRQNKKKVEIHHSTYKDNEFIDIEYTETLEDLIDIDENIHAVYAKGLWGRLRNLIYSNYRIESFNYYELTWDYEVYALDFGFTNPCCLLHMGFKGNDVYITELLYQTHLTNSDLIKLLNQEHITEWLPSGAPNRKRGLKIYADSEDPAAIEEIRRAGFNIEQCYKHQGSVAEGIKKVLEKTLILEKNSINLINEIRAYKRKEDKLTGQVLEEPVKFNDHAMKAMQYGIYTKELTPGATDWDAVKKANVKTKERKGVY